MGWFLQTKIAPPRLSEKTLVRKSLLRSLDQAFSDGKSIVFLSAPAGYGKSTLLAQWLSLQSEALCWYSFGAMDQPSRLARHLAEALAYIKLREPKINGEPSLEEILALCCKTDNKFNLVLDDYHLHQSSEIDRFLLELCTNLPSGLKVLVSSRQPLNPSLSKLYAHEDFDLWEFGALRLTSTESWELLGLLGAKIDKEGAEELHRATEGWPAALQLLSLSGKADTRGVSSLANLCDQTEIWNYLAHEVFAQQEPSTQTKLLSLSLLEIFDRSIARDLDLGFDDVIGNSWGPFVIELKKEGESWYRFHHLLGLFLRELASLRLSDLEKTSIHIRASESYEKRGYFEEAVRQAFKARDWDRAERLLTGDEILERILRHYSNSHHWLEVLPDSCAKDNGLLCTNLGLVYGCLGRFKDSRAFLARALKDPNWQEDFLCLAGLSFCYAGLGDETRAFEFEQKARILERDISQQAIGDFFLACVMMYRGDSREALKQMELVKQMSRPSSIVVQTSCDIALGNLFMQAGRLDESLSTINQFLDRAGSVGLMNKPSWTQNILATAWGLKARAQTHRGEMNEAAESWNKFETAKQEHGVPFFFAVMVSSKVRFLVYTATLAEAREYLDSHFLTADTIYAALLRGIQAELLILEDKIEEAEALLAQWMHGFDLEKNFVYYHQPLYVARTNLSLVKRDLKSIEQSRLWLNQLITRATRDGRVWDIIDLNMHLACVEVALNELDSARQLVKNALQLGRPLGYVQVFLQDSSAGKLARAADDTLPTQGPKQDDFPFQLDVRELQILELLSEGLSNQEIADRLFLGLHTIKWYNRRIYQKMGVKRRTQASAVFRNWNSPRSG